jgi:16S rRNA A1518/A1519 N6-dimethyltransferase RsmA/KsgA/DIM1 with predicted DNA glycosylase/AP lyase activity
MESVVAGKIVRDGDDQLLVLSEEVVVKLDIREGDDLIPVGVEDGKLTLELVRKAE